MGEGGEMIQFAMQTSRDDILVVNPSAPMSSAPMYLAPTDPPYTDDYSEVGASPSVSRGESAPYLVLSWDDRRPTARGASTCLLGGESGPAGPRAAGAFAEWHWDGRRLEVRTDRFGFQPLFHAVSGTTLWLSPSIPEVLRQGAPAELDDAALAVFLRIGEFLGDDTPFRYVRAVPPAARLTWEEGRVTIESSRAVLPLRDIGRDAAIDDYIEVFRAAMAKEPVDPSRTLIPLTGGRDSRHILLELHAAGLRTPCATARADPSTPNEDIIVAAAVAEAAGVPHIGIDIGDRYTDEIEKNLRTSLCTFEHFWVTPLIRHVASRSLVIYDGIAGDTLSEAKYMNAQRLALFRQNDLRGCAVEELGGHNWRSSSSRVEVPADVSLIALSLACYVAVGASLAGTG